MAAKIVKSSSTNKLIGKTFNYLTVLNSAGYYKNKVPLISCKCICGNIIERSAYKVKKGIFKSCGCKKGELTSKRCSTHGQSKTSLYRRYKTMMNRCYMSTHISYPHYGEIGITVAKRWHNFENFLQDMGQPPTTKHTIERTNNTQGYSKQNCCWATRKENSANTSIKRIWTIFGEDFLDIHEAAKKYNCSRTTIMRWCGQDKNRPKAKKKTCSSRLVYPK